MNTIEICCKCPHHVIKNDNGDKFSYCKKEGCFPVHTNCIARLALEKFLIQN